MRIYSEQELRSLFGERFYFRDMSEDQINGFKIYVSKRYALKQGAQFANWQSMSDADVYIDLQKKVKQTENDSNTVTAKDYDKLHSIYKKMCKELGLDLREHIEQILDLGTAHTKSLVAMKYIFYAKYANGVSIDREVSFRNENVNYSLKKYKDMQMDMIVCNKALSSFDEQVLCDALDQLCRLTRKYMIIRDYQLDDNFNLTKEMIVQKELANGVIQPSAIPDLLKTHKCDYEDLFNKEFSLTQSIKYICSQGFSVVYQPQNIKSLGNVNIAVLKRNDYVHPPLSNQEDSWRSSMISKPAYHISQSDKGENVLLEQAHLLQGKALINSLTDSYKHISVLLNKLVRSNQRSVISQIVQTYQQLLAPEQDAFLKKLSDKVKNCKQQPDVIALLFRHMSAIDINIAQSLQEIVKDTAQQLIDAKCSEDEFMKLYNQMDSFARFLAHMCTYKFFTYKITVVQQIVDAVYIKPELIATMTLHLSQNAIHPRLHEHLREQIQQRISDFTAGSRVRCLLLNAISA